jgi:hypothetical protein
MNAFRPVLLLFSSGILLLASCNPSVLKDFVQKPQPDQGFAPVFNEKFTKLIYTTNQIIGKQSLSGIIIIKRIEHKKSFRIVCMAETGLKYFDCEFFPGDSSVVHYMMDALNRKKIVDLIISDLGLIFKTGLNEDKTTYFESENPSGGFVLKQKKRERIYFFYAQESQPPVKIIQRPFLSSRSEVEINYDAKQLPTGIIITNNKRKASIELEILPKR